MPSARLMPAATVSEEPKAGRNMSRPLGLRREPGGAGAAQLLPLLHGVAVLHRDRGEVGVEGLQPPAMVQHHRVAVDGERRREDHHSRIGGRHRAVPAGGEVVAQVHLHVHLAPLVAVGARLREVREHLGVARLHEGPLPQGSRLAAGGELALGLLRGLALLAVDPEKGGNDLGGARVGLLGKELRHLLPEELLLLFFH